MVFFVGVAVAILAGCAHPIKVAPDIAKIEQSAGANDHVAASVGYYSPPELDSLEVTTPGGGGDKITDIVGHSTAVEKYEEIRAAKALSNIGNIASTLFSFTPFGFVKGKILKIILKSK
jgi:hypothetical protein